MWLSRPRCSITAVKLKISGLIALSLAILAVMGIQIPLLPDSPLDMTLRDATHALLFGLLTYAWLKLLRPGAVVLRLMLLSLLLLALCAEIIEGLVYNGWSIADLSGNLLGVILGYALWKLVELRAPRWPAGIPYGLVAMLILSITVILPVTLAVHRSVEQHQWYPVLLDAGMRSARPQVVFLSSEQNAEFAWTDRGLYLHLLENGIRGLVLTDFEPDWTRHSFLIIDVENPSPAPFRFEMHIRDRTGSAEWGDRFNFEQNLESGTRAQLRIPLKEIEYAPADRVMDLSQIAVIAIYSGAEGSDSIILHNIALE